MAEFLYPVGDDNSPFKADGSGQVANLCLPPGTLKSLEAPAVSRIRADGQPMKKRGPKARNTPALSRKQELARKAQRSHRDRKELYVKALEQEVLQLKDDVSVLSSSYESLERENRQVKSNLSAVLNISALLKEENQQLRQLIEHHSTSSPYAGGIHGLASQAIPCIDSQILGTTTADAGVSSMTTVPSLIQESSNNQAGDNDQYGIDHDQAGIDFVLALERPCLCHMRVEPEGALYGHALMASYNHGMYPETRSEIPLDSTCDRGQESCTLSKSVFTSLLERSQRLNLDGEVTPVMVWDMILKHPRLPELTSKDFEKITQDLATRVKCYGFGAVFEEFEVREIIENIILSKSEL